MAEAPRQYMCMCGAVADPAFDPWLLPHTCGATCGHELQPACGHSCLLLCHPGPCPPCPRQVLPCPGHAWPEALAYVIMHLYPYQISLILGNCTQIYDTGSQLMIAAVPGLRIAMHLLALMDLTEE